MTVPTGALPRPVGEPTDLRPEVCGVFGPAVTYSADGSLVALWDEFDGLLARHRPAGEPLLGEPVMLTPSASLPRHPRIAPSPDGRVVVAWMQGPSESSEIVFRVFDADGRPLGDEHLVTGADLDCCAPPALAVADDLVAIATHHRSPAAAEGTRASTIELDIFSTAGERIAGGVVVAEMVGPLGGGGLGNPGLAISEDGTLIVHWEEMVEVDDTPVRSAQARQYFADGLPASDSWELFAGWSPYRVSVAPLPSSSWLFVATTPAGIAAEGWDGPGLPKGPPRDLADDGRSPVVAVSPGLPPFAVWIDGEIDTDRLWMRELAPDGEPRGAAIEITVPTGGFYIRDLTIGSHPTGRFVLGWQMVWYTGIIPTTCNSGYAVYLLELDATLLRDGFESGDFGAWSSATP